MCNVVEHSNDLRSIPLFAALDEPTLADTMRLLQLQEFRSGEFILLEGDVPPGLYIVVRGRVRLSRAAHDGREQVLSTIHPGAQLNVAAIIDNQPSLATARAMTPVQCYLLPRSALLALIRRRPELALALLQDMAAQLRDLMLLVDDLAFRSVSERMARHLLREAAYGEAEFTQQELAERVGTVREIAGRVLRQFAQRGFVRLERGRVIVLDRLGLERVVEP